MEATSPLKRQFGAIIIFNLIVAGLMFMMAAPAWAGPATDFVKKKSGDLFKVVNQPVGAARTAAMKKEVRALVNYEELASRALGKHWAARSDGEKKEFVGLLEQLVELNYANRFKEKSTDKNYEVKYLDEKVRASTRQAIVKSSVQYGGETFTLDYKLLETASAVFTIYDVVFDDISLEETYRESYVPIIDKEGWGSLIKRMKDKLKELKSR